MNKLTRNFNFFEQSNDSRWNDVILFLEKIEKNQISDYEKVQKICNCLDKVLDIYFVDNNINIENDRNQDSYNKNKETYFKISYFEKRNIISSEFVTAMHTLRLIRNQIAHGENKKIFISSNDVIHYLKQFFYIVKEIFSEDVFTNIKDLEFDETIYYFTKSNNINAISSDQRDRDNKQYNTKRDIVIEQDSILSWLKIPNAKLFIPIYQRKYTWEEWNVEVLIQDILERINNDEDHYFGTIAQKFNQRKNKNDVDLVKIIDGQQRLTTSLLIISAVRDYLLNKKCINYDNKIFSWYLNIKDEKQNQLLGNYIYNPGGEHYENESFKLILNNEKGKTIDELFKKSLPHLKTKFTKNYSYIYKRLETLYDNKPASDVVLFVTTFLNRFIVASISFDNDRFSNKREMIIFESLNSKGKDLELIDFIKNHIMNYCDEEIINSYEKEIALKYNEATANINLKELEEFYKFLTEYINGKEIQNEKISKIKSTKEALDKFFDKYTIEEINNINDFQKIMNKLNNYLNIFKEIENNNGKFIKELGIQNIMNIITNNKKTKLFSYFLFLIFEKMIEDTEQYKTFINNEITLNLSKEDKKSIENMFLEVAKFLIRTKVITKQGDSNIKRKLMEISNKYRNMKYTSITSLCSDIINDFNDVYKNSYTFIDFKNALENNSDHNQIQELLILTEYIMSNSLNGGEAISRITRSIEHILPQNHEKWLNEISDTEKDWFKEKVELYKNKIGNYLVLTKGNNSKSSNEIFLTKKDKVYKGLLSPLYKNDNVNIDISKKTKWTFDDIDKRTESLIEYILKNVITN